MKLIDYTIEGFYKELASDSPAPGGGSTAAVEASFGCGLIAMVCELTIRNKKFADDTEKYQKILEEAHRLGDQVQITIDKDTDAFMLVSRAFSLPKETDEEKQARKQAIQEGLKGCCYPPMETMKIAYDGLKLAAGLIQKYNTNAASDLGSGVASLKAALHSAYLNVLINIGSIQDQAFVAEMEKEAETLYKEGTAIANSLFGIIADSLKTQAV